jgi:hypothetical protein
MVFRLVLVVLTVSALAAAWLVVSAFLGPRYAIEHSSLASDVRDASIAVGRLGTREECPPFSAGPPGAEGLQAGSPQSVKVETLKDDGRELRAEARCGEWIRVQAAPEQWLHLSTRTLVTLTK